MAPNQTVPSFDDIIKAGRERKKDEELANQMLGKGRRESAPGIRRKSERPLGLASRITKASKRATSASPVLKAKVIAHNGKQHSLLSRDNSLNEGSRVMSEHVNNTTLDTRRPIKSFSIKGFAGPYVVVGSNFAPGTTSADIQSALDSVAGGMQSCRIITSNPTVVAEMIYEDKACADAVIATFNNQRASAFRPCSFTTDVLQQADGRLLHVYMKQGGPTPFFEADHNHATPLTDTKLMSRDKLRSDSSYMDVDGQNSGSNSKRADPEIQDGSYGFESREEVMEIDNTPKYDARREERRDDRKVVRDHYRRDYEPEYIRDDRGVRNEPRRGERSLDQAGRIPDGRRTYSRDFYPRQRGRGFR